MSKRIRNLGGVNIGPAVDIPGYAYDPVNDRFLDEATGNWFTSEQTPAKPEQTKTVNATENGPLEIEPDEGKTLSKVTVNVNVNVPVQTTFYKWDVDGLGTSCVVASFGTLAEAEVGMKCLVTSAAAGSATQAEVTGVTAEAVTIGTDGTTVMLTNDTAVASVQLG